MFDSYEELNTYLQFKLGSIEGDSSGVSSEIHLPDTTTTEHLQSCLVAINQYLAEHADSDDIGLALLWSESIEKHPMFQPIITPQESASQVNQRDKLSELQINSFKANPLVMKEVLTQP